MRIVSLACSNTEIVCALGCADLLVGVDDHSDFPVDVVAPLPKVGPDLEIDVERVSALEPDLVLATLTVPGHERVVERLDAAGLPYIAPEPVSLTDVYADVRDIGARLGVPDRAERLVEEMQSELNAPDAVVLSWCGVHPDKYRPDVVLEKPAWAGLEFVQKGRVYCVGEPFLGRPGPRLVDGVKAMRTIVEEVKDSRS